MKNLQKGFAGIMALVIIGVLVVGGGVYVYNKKSQTSQELTTPTVVSNVAGFSFSVPVGWHIWETASAGQEVLVSDGFMSVIGEALKEGEFTKTISVETAQKLQPYQVFMKNWNVNTAKIISFTNANVDYKNRDLALAGKISSILIDSQEMIDQHQVTMMIGSSGVTKPITPRNDADSERKNITINGTPAIYGRSKQHKLVDNIIVLLPVNTRQSTSTLMFQAYVKKDDAAASDAIISFISSLNIKGNN